MGKLWKYNAKALPEGTVRTWGTRQYKKEGGKWVGIKRGVGKEEKKEPSTEKQKDKSSNIDSRDINIINREMKLKSDKIREKTYNLTDSQLKKQISENEKYKDGYNKLVTKKEFGKRKDLQDYYYGYSKYQSAKKEMERRDYVKKVEAWKKLPQPKDEKFKQVREEFDSFMKKFKGAGKREQAKMQQEHDNLEKKAIGEFLKTYKSPEEYARSMLGRKQSDFLGRETSFGDEPEKDLKHATMMFDLIKGRAKEYGVI